MKKIVFKNRKLGLSKYGFPQDFYIYGIDGGVYDFTDNLDFPANQDGVYIFFTAFPKLDMDRMDTIFQCTMRYCGKTKDLRERFDQHHHKDDLKQHNPLYIAVSCCKDENEITGLEKSILNYFHFEYNDPELNKGSNTETIEAVKISEL